MGLQKLKELDWFFDSFDEDTLELMESNFQTSKMTQLAITAWAQHEITKLDKEITLTKLRETPDRAELALLVAGQRESLLKLINLLDSKE